MLALQQAADAFLLALRWLSIELAVSFQLFSDLGAMKLRSQDERLRWVAKAQDAEGALLAIVGDWIRAANHPPAGEPVLEVESPHAIEVLEVEFNLALRDFEGEAAVWRRRDEFDEVLRTTSQIIGFAAASFDVLRQLAAEWKSLRGDAYKSAGSGAVKPTEPKGNRPPLEDEPFDPQGSVGAARPWTLERRLEKAQLPRSGEVPFEPRPSYHPSEPLPRGPNNGFVDRYGNEWNKGRAPSRSGEPFEWDVTFQRGTPPWMRALSRDGKHINVSVTGKITH